MSVLVFGVIIAVLLLFGLPIVYAFLGASLAYFLANGMNVLHAFRITILGANSFVFLAIPFFILTAEFMNYGKISDALFDLANKLVGHIPGGLSHVNILTSVFFAGMSGSAIADMGGIGSLSFRAMDREGFPKPYSAAVTVSSSIIGPIIPPSITMVVYGGLTQASVGALFLGGVIPGLLMGIVLSVYCFFVSRRRGYPRSARPRSLGEVWLAFKRSSLPLMTPVILLGGIYLGVFTPTEAAGVAAFYSLILLLASGKASLRGFITVGKNVVRTTAKTLTVIASVALFSWIISIEKVPQMVYDLIVAYDLSRVQFLIVVNIVLLILGCFLPVFVTLLAFIPIIIPIASSLGISLVHFGVIVVVNLMIGSTTPPFGLQLFLAKAILNVEISDVLKEIWPMIIGLVIVVLLATFVEPLVMFLPNTMR